VCEELKVYDKLNCITVLQVKTVGTVVLSHNSILITKENNSQMFS